MIRCAYCGVQNAADARFCSWCGRELPNAPIDATLSPGEASEPTQPVYAGAPPPYSPPPNTPPPAPPALGEWFASAPRWFWPTAAVVASLTLVCACSLLAVLLFRPLRGAAPAFPWGPSSTPTWTFPTAPPTLAPPTPFPTFTPAPSTQTPLPPLPPTSTATATLTFTPPPVGEPTEAAQPAPTQVWTRYLTPECAAAITRLRAASDRFTANPLTVFDAQWRAELRAAGEETRLQCGSLDQASPVPGQMAEAQRSLALASAEFDQAARLLEEGTRDWNPGKMWQGMQGLGRAAGHLNRALDALAGNEP